jgi:hypothetical protein
MSPRYTFGWTAYNFIGQASEFSEPGFALKKVNVTVGGAATFSNKAAGGDCLSLGCLLLIDRPPSENIQIAAKKNSYFGRSELHNSEGPLFG